LLESEATVRALFEHASQGILMVDVEGRIVQANAMIEELFGYKRAELHGQPVELLLPARFRSRHAEHRAHYVAEPRPRPMGLSQELAGVRKDGCEFPVEISLSHIVSKHGDLAVAFVSDITIRKRVESALRESETRFHAFMENSPALAFIKDENGRMVWTNRSNIVRSSIWARRYLICGHRQWPNDCAPMISR
jgi:PAS domain S-box-containing protein